MAVLNIIGNIQDSLDTNVGENRKFVFNRGEFDAKKELWNIDLLEIIKPTDSYGDFTYLCNDDGDRILTSSGEYIIL